MRIPIILALFTLCAIGQVTETTITDTVRIPISSGLFNGMVDVRPSHSMTCSSTAYGPVPVQVNVANGILSMSLVPNASCSPLDSEGNPASYYTARFVDRTRGITWTETWVVPVSAVSVPLSTIRSAVPASAAIMITLTQIAQSGATTNQVATWNGSNWVAAAPAAAAHASTHAAAGSDPVTVAESQVTGLTTALSGKEPTIAAGTTAQYWRGDKSWQTLDKSVVGLGNVENTAISTWAGSANITALGTLASGVLPWTLVTGAPSTYAPSGHATNHQHGGSDEIATATPAANAIPKAGAGGTLGAGWIPALSYAPPTSGTDILKGNGSGGFSAASAGTDYIAPYTSQTANYFLAAPNGSAGVPSFRAIVAADIPTLNQSTTGSAATITGSVVKANTPLTTKGDLWVTDGTNMHRLGVGTNDHILTADSTATDGVKWAAAPSGMVYPGTGVPNSTGSAWGTSYAVGTAASNLVQLNASAQLPAVSAALLTNFPTLNQNTTGTAAGLAAQYVDWNASSGGTSIANKPTLGALALSAFPGTGVPNSTGSAWGTSYTVGTAASNLVQLNASAQLPAVSAALLTNFPTLNQNTTGTAAGLSATLSLASGGTNQTSWTASRCVQVAADGTKLESASAACGSGSASSPYAITFTSSTTQTVTAATHGLGTDPLDGGCYTVTTGAKIIPSSWAKNSSGDVTITVDPAWTGTCYLHAGAGYTGGGAVSSVFGRTGAVVSATNDYAMSQISGTAAISQGGTGATTAAAARVALFPSMTGNALKRVRVNTGATDIEYVTSSYDLEGSATLSSWGTIGAGACVEKNLTLTGAVSGDKLVAGWPSTLEAGIMGMMIPGTDLAVVRLCNVTGSGVAVADGKTFAVGALR